MAARKDSRIKTKHREAIQTSMLINRLSSHAHSIPFLPDLVEEWLQKHGDGLSGEAQDELRKRVMKVSVNMEQSQVRAAQILLNKSLPDLRSIELTGDEDNPIAFALPIEYVEPDPSEET